MKVAVLGTGIMGAGMARSLRRSGHEVRAWNRTRSKAEPLERDGVTIADSAAEAVAGADAVVTVLFDADATVAVAEQMLEELGPDAVWVQSGTVGVDGIRRLEEMAADRIVDAPVLGTRKPAEDGTLVVLASGPPRLLESARPVFEAVGSRTVKAGNQPGDATALKLACNAWVGMLTAATAQSLAMAETLGVDPRLVLESIEGGPLWAPYAGIKGGMMLAGDYTPSFEVDGVVKDVGLMIDAVDGSDFPTSLLAAVRDQFVHVAAAGHGSEDMAAVRRVYP